MPERSALYLSHNGMTEPLGQSQVMPYLRGLAAAGWRIHLVAFEPAAARAGDIAAAGAALARDGIGYTPERRSPSHALGVKALESGLALARLAALAVRLRPRIVHARSYLPAAVALALASVVPGLRFLFDCRGLLWDEYVDAGHWRRESLRYRALKRLERRLYRRADAVVTLTGSLRRWLEGERYLAPGQPVEVIPCCVDLARFTAADEASRRASRARLAVGERFVLAYAGSLGSWYCEEEMAALYAALRRRRPARFLVLTHARTERLRAALARLAVPAEEVTVEAVPHTEMPRVLAGADAAVSFIAPCFSKIGSSPVKNAEYLATGLPVVMNRGIGDGDELIDGVPAVIDAGRLSPEEIERAAEALATRDLAALRTVARRAAAERFCVETVGVARYRRLYERLAG